jgi:hypothetical protein
MKRLPHLSLLAIIAALLFCSNAQAQQRTQYETLVAAHAQANGVPEVLVHRVIVRESKYQPMLVGRGGTIGLMQIKLATARGLGYTGTAEGLRDPETNLTYGVKYLAGAYRAANSDHSRAVHYYASGYYYAAKRQRLERTRHPEPVLASVPPQVSGPSVAAGVTEAAGAPEAAALAEETEPMAGAKVAASKLKFPPKKLADAKAQVPRPRAGTAGGANAAMPR